MSISSDRLDREGRIIAAVQSSATAAAQSCAPCALLRAWTGIRTTGEPVEDAQGLLVATTALAFWLECLERNQPIAARDLDEFKTRALALKSASPSFDVQSAIDAVIVAAGRLEVQKISRLSGVYHAIPAAWSAHRDPNLAGEITLATNGVSGACLRDPIIAES